jgi:hypothetical protein
LRNSSAKSRKLPRVRKLQKTENIGVKNNHLVDDLRAIFPEDLRHLRPSRAAR